MTGNQRTVMRYMEGFNRSDHAQILSCLTDDVEWEMPGTFRLAGKAAFDREIENDGFTGSPVVTVTRMVEENGVVVAEGTVRATRRGGEPLDLVFCDVFAMADERIRRLTSYVVVVKPGPAGD